MAEGRRVFHFLQFIRTDESLKGFIDVSAISALKRVLLFAKRFSEAVAAALEIARRTIVRQRRVETFVAEYFFELRYGHSLRVDVDDSISQSFSFFLPLRPSGQSLALSPSRHAHV